MTAEEVAGSVHEPVAHVPLVLPLDLDDRLEQDRVVAERRRLGYGAVRSLIFGRSRLEGDGFPVGPADAPQSSATSDEDANGKPVACPAKLDVAVGKAQPQDRWLRCAVIGSHDRVSSARPRLVRGEQEHTQPSSARSLLGGTALRRFLDECNPHDDRHAIPPGGDSPQLAPTADRVADLWRRVRVGGIDLEGAVGKTDFETPTRHERGMPTGCDAKTGSPSWLHESVAHARMLTQQNAAELGQFVRRLLEDAKDRLAVLHSDSDEPLSSVQRDRKCVGGVLEPGLEEALNEIQDVLMANRNAGEHQRRHVPRRLVAVGRYVGRRGARLTRPLAGGWRVARLWSAICRLLVVFEVARFRLVFALWVSAVHGVCHVRPDARIDPKRNRLQAELCRRLHEPLAHAPLVLVQEHGSKHGECGRRVVERSKDRLAILDRESDQLLLRFQRDDDRLGRIIEPGVMQESDEDEHVLVAHGDAGEHHRGVVTP